MTFRYSLRRLHPQDDPIDILDEITRNGTEAAHAIAEDDLQLPWREVIEHLKFIGARTLLIQSEVFDPDYLEEHQAFYAKQHRSVKRTCKRVHAFNVDFVEGASQASSESDDLRRDVLAFLEQASSANDSYLGFISVRPLRHAPVGATIVRLPTIDQPTVWDAFPVHIAGKQFEVRGTPFLQQDNAVGVCAQASMWMALRSLRRRHGNAAYSPAELTIAATRYLAMDRPFPGRQGLTTGQMLDAVRFAGHDPLHVALRQVTQPGKHWVDVVAEAAPYVDSGLPVLVVLAKDPTIPGPHESDPIQDDPDGDTLPQSSRDSEDIRRTDPDQASAGHVVVAIGLKPMKTAVANHVIEHGEPSRRIKLRYRQSANWVRGFVVHNDGEGPYGRLVSRLSDPNADYTLEDVCSLIVVLPDGVFTSAGKAYDLAVRSLWRACSVALASVSGMATAPEVDLVLRPLLCTRHAFRTWAMSEGSLDPEVRDRYRTHGLPSYVWVVEIHDAKLFCPSDPETVSRLGEVVLDASADPLHADSHIFTSITPDLWPSQAPLNLSGVLLSESEDDGLKAVSIKDSRPGRGIREPWIG